MHTDPMRCTKCNSPTTVIDSRTSESAENNKTQYAHLTMAQAVWHGDAFRSRRRRCKKCNVEFDTIEVPIGQIKA